jgi:hypothetical protein
LDLTQSFHPALLDGLLLSVKGTLKRVSMVSCPNDKILF